MLTRLLSVHFVAAENRDCAWRALPKSARGRADGEGSRGKLALEPSPSRGSCREIWGGLVTRSALFLRALRPLKKRVSMTRGGAPASVSDSSPWVAGQVPALRMSAQRVAKRLPHPPPDATFTRRSCKSRAKNRRPDPWNAGFCRGSEGERARIDSSGRRAEPSGSALRTANSRGFVRPKATRTALARAIPPT